MNILNQLKNNLTILTLTLPLLLSLNAEAGGPPSTMPDFTINQKVHLNNIQDEITRVELKCALTCNMSGYHLGDGSILHDFFDENIVPSGKAVHIAGFSQTLNLQLNNGAINTTKTLKINANRSRGAFVAKKEHVTGYICALAFYEGNKMIAGDRELEELPWRYDPRDPEISLPAGIQNLPTRWATKGQINNLFNPTSFQNCSE